MKFKKIFLKNVKKFKKKKNIKIEYVKEKSTPNAHLEAENPFGLVFYKKNR